MFRTCVMLIVAFSLFGCASMDVLGGDDSNKADGVRGVTYNASTIVFNRIPTPVITEKEFASDATINISGTIKSYRFKNKILGDVGTVETEVVLAVSGRTAGFGVYDKSGIPLVEFSKGEVWGDSVHFKKKSPNGVVTVRWFLGDKLIASIVESTDNKGNLIYSEVTTYKPVGF